mmetsp:Transcript_19821/g.32498  ORF Transcript_19821/g.32498 Transcript_19821/m.32498 type:complete len:141 (+) Transcript_19821:639-1061(+)
MECILPGTKRKHCVKTLLPSALVQCRPLESSVGIRTPFFVLYWVQCCQLYLKNRFESPAAVLAFSHKAPQTKRHKRRRKMSSTALFPFIVKEAKHMWPFTIGFAATLYFLAIKPALSVTPEMRAKSAYVTPKSHHGDDHH